MNREIKFKYYLQHGETGRICSKSFTLEEIEQGKFQQWWDDLQRTYAMIAKCQLFVPSGEPTEEFYEGDIVERTEVDWSLVTDEMRENGNWDDYPRKTSMKDVVTLERLPCYWLKNESFGYEGEDLESPQNCKVIGNIYDNPELLNWR